MQKISAFLSKEIQELTDLKQEGQKLYLVGGVIRDYCIGRENHDIDVLCDLDTRLIARKFADVHHGVFFVMDTERNTSRVILSTETGKKYYDFARLKGSSLIEDLFARDFSINAMAVDLDHPEEIIDPTGGQTDLKNHLLRECSADSFASDPVRIIRAVRYSLGYDLKIDSLTLNHLKASLQLLERVSGERKRDELFKILESTNPQNGFSMLHDLGIFKQMGFPQVEHKEEIKQRVGLLNEFLTGIYSSTQIAEKEVTTAFTLFSEETRGKLKEYLQKKNSSDRNEHQIILLASILMQLDPAEVDRVGALLLLSREERENLLMIVTNQNFKTLIEARRMPDDREMYHYFRATGKTGVDLAIQSLVNTCAGCENSHDLFIRDLCQKVIAFWFEKPEMANPVMLVNGKDIMVNFDLTPGPLIGELLEELREEQAAGSITTRKEALEWVETELAKRISLKPWNE